MINLNIADNSKVKNLIDLSMMQRTAKDVERLEQDDAYEDQADDEIIVNKKVNLKALFGKGLGGGGLSSSYKMTYVPLKVGVKINPDGGLYSAASQKVYKDRAMYLMTEKIRLEYDEMEEQERLGMKRNPAHE